jgi:hypothetical protein
VWTPAHIAIYVALLIAFAYNAYLVAAMSFGRRRAEPAIEVFGLRGPAGAFVTLWGILLQTASIFFDNWWHSVYGLDIAVFSPPHAILAWGITTFYCGQILLAIRWHNLAPPGQERLARWQFLVLWALLIGHATISVDPSYGPLAVRSPAFIVSAMLGYPIFLIFPAVYLDRLWSGVTAAAVYMAHVILLMQVFEQVPATPRFGPVYHHDGILLPPPFPLWAVVPAALVALLLPRVAGRVRSAALILGSAVALGFTAVNWLGSALLTSPWGHNRFLGGGYPGGVFEAEFRRAPQLNADLGGLVTVLASISLAGLLSAATLRAARWFRTVVR